MRAAVIVFPGSNCDRDAALALKRVTGKPALMVWHKETELPKLDLVVVPGGFSYGDYLRSGAMAARAPVMREVARRAGEGVPILGICNGFQILTEVGLLPGALMRNASLSFVHKLVTLEVASTSTMFTVLMSKGDRLAMPIAHGEGNYFADPATLDRLEGEGRVVFRYTDNPNGSARNIAGIVNERGNVMGLMPHPERACDPATGLLDGRRIFESIISAQPSARAGAA